MNIEHRHLSGYTISTDKSKLNAKIIHAFLAATYWAKNRTFQQIETVIEKALCFGVYHNDQQIGFARVVTDYAVIAYLGDVFVLPAHQGKGLGKWLVDVILNHPELQQVTWLLATQDAHTLYEKFGFSRHPNPERLMKRN